MARSRESSIAREIVEDMTPALVEFEAVAAALETSSTDS